jgi:hypothetical protein
VCPAAGCPMRQAALDQVARDITDMFATLTVDTSSATAIAHEILFQLIDMSVPTRTLPHIRQASAAGASLNASSASQSAALQARVNDKKAELEHLRQLRDLSAAMAIQMEALQQKLSTLADGTEGAPACWTLLRRIPCLR